MYILFAAIAVTFIGSFASSFAIVLVGHTIKPAVFQNPIYVKTEFGRKGWQHIAVVSALTWLAIFLTSFIFLCFSGLPVFQMLVMASIIATLGLIGFLNFMYFIFLMGK
jgi:hypothetical protein